MHRTEAVVAEGGGEREEVAHPVLEGVRASKYDDLMTWIVLKGPTDTVIVAEVDVIPSVLIGALIVNLSAEVTAFRVGDHSSAFFHWTSHCLRAERPISPP